MGWVNFLTIDTGTHGQYDALDLAAQAINDWDAWLRQRSLLATAQLAVGTYSAYLGLGVHPRSGRARGFPRGRCRSKDGADVVVHG
jgi:hypothetical protein